MRRVVVLGIIGAAMLAGLSMDVRAQSGEDSRGLWQINAAPKAKKGSPPPHAFNPKEFKLDQKADWKKTPKTKTLCVPPGGGKPRAC